MSQLLGPAAVVYVAGIVWSLLRSDARARERVVLSLLWPLGPLAFLATIAFLLAASLIAFPLFGIAVLATAVIVWLALF